MNPVDLTFLSSGMRYDLPTIFETVIKISNINANSKFYQSIWPFPSVIISVELDRSFHDLKL